MPFSFRSSIRRASTSGVVGLLLSLGCGFLLQAQPTLSPVPNLWHPDGPINATVQVGSVAYVGGAFGYVGTISGSLASASKTDGASSPLPRLNGTVITIQDDGAGGHFVGGNFTEEATGLRHLIHLNADRTVDQSFAPKPSDTVRALALHGTNLFVAGNFLSIAGSAGQVRRYLTAIHPVTGALNTWNAFPNQPILTLLVAPDAIYAAGGFSSIGGQARTRLAKLNLATAAAFPWNPGVSGGAASIAAMALDGTTLYVGGDFTTVGAKPRNRIGALNTTVDTNNGTDWNPNSNGRVASIAVSGDTIYVGGAFTSIGSLTRTNLAGLNATTAQATAGLAINANAAVEAVRIIDGALHIVGGFSRINGSIRRGLARLDPITGALADWSPLVSSLSPTATPSVFAIQPAGTEVLFGGSFLSSGGANRANIAALDLTTGRATPWAPDANNQVYSLAADSSVVYAGGIFTEIGGAARARLAALNTTDGSATDFVANVTATAANGVNVIVAAADRVYVGGTFTAVNGTNRNNLARLAPSDGFVSKDFIPNPNAAVRAMLLEGANLYVGGDFSSIGASNRIALAMIAPDTGRASAFNARINANGFIRALASSAGQLYVAGDYSSIGGLSRRKLASLDPVNGDASPTWNPDIGVADNVRTFALAASGHAAYVGGSFLSAGGEFRNYLASVAFNNSAATIWNPGIGTGSGFEIRNLHYGSTHLLVGGEFMTVGSAFRPYLVAFSLRPSLPLSLATLTAAGNAKFTIFDGDGSGSQVELQGSPTLLPATWTAVQTGAITGTGSTFEDTATQSQPNRVFRAVAKP